MNCARIVLLVLSVLFSEALFAAQQQVEPSEPSESTAPATQPSEACNVNNSVACGTSPWTAMCDAELKAKLTPEQFHIAREAGTQRAFTGKLWGEHRAGDRTVPSALNLGAVKTRS